MPIKKTKSMSEIELKKATFDPKFLDYMKYIKKSKQKDLEKQQSKNVAPIDQAIALENMQKAQNQYQTLKKIQYNYECKHLKQAKANLEQAEVRLKDLKKQNELNNDPIYRESMDQAQTIALEAKEQYQEARNQPTIKQLEQNTLREHILGNILHKILQNEALKELKREHHLEIDPNLPLSNQLEQANNKLSELSKEKLEQQLNELNENLINIDEILFQKRMDLHNVVEEEFNNNYNPFDDQKFVEKTRRPSLALEHVEQNKRQIESRITETKRLINNLETVLEAVGLKITILELKKYEQELKN